MDLGRFGSVSRTRVRLATGAAMVALAVAGITGAVHAAAPSSSASVSESSSASSTTSIPVGTSDHTLTVGGRQRSFLVYRPTPTSKTPKSYPLVLMFHGGTGSAEQAERSYGWNAQAQQHQFLAVYPQGVAEGWSVGGGCCGYPAKLGVNDVDYTKAVVSEIEGLVPVDHKRIYATGLSEGAMLDYHLACDTSIFAAIAPVSGTELGSCDSPSKISLLDIHGTSDPRIPYNGDIGAGINHINGPSTKDLVKQWRDTDDCTGHTTTHDGPVAHSVANCPSHRNADEITINGGGHHWPGTPAPAGPTGTSDRVSNSFDATPLIWSFFAAHPKP